MAAAVITIGTLFEAKVAHSQIRVLAVDPHQLVQEGLSAMINREEDMIVVATASSGEEALDDVRRYRPDVVTLDLMLPDMAGEDLARRILAEFPQTRIVAITAARGHVHAQRAVDAGIHGYLSKAAPRYELSQAGNKRASPARKSAAAQARPGRIARAVHRRHLFHTHSPQVHARPNL